MSILYMLRDFEFLRLNIPQEIRTMIIPAIGQPIAGVVQAVTTKFTTE